MRRPLGVFFFSLSRASRRSDSSPTLGRQDCPLAGRLASASAAAHANLHSRFFRARRPGKGCNKLAANHRSLGARPRSDHLSREKEREKGSSKLPPITPGACSSARPPACLSVRLSVCLFVCFSPAGLAERSRRARLAGRLARSLGHWRQVGVPAAICSPDAPFACRRRRALERPVGLAPHTSLGH